MASYVVYLLTLVAIYSVLAVALNLVAGNMGLVSLAQAVFFGIGAYAVAVLTQREEWTWWSALLLGGVLAALVAVGLGLVSLRLRGDYFVIATFILQVAFFGVAQNWVGLTEGPLGIAGIEKPRAFVSGTPSDLFMFLLAFVSLLVSFLAAWRISSAPLGRVLAAIREDETIALQLGKDVATTKVIVFGASAFLSAVAGGVYASFISYIDPTLFGLDDSVLVLAMVALGGAGSLTGPVLGAAVLVLLPEALRLLGLPGSAAANLRQVVYGFLLVAIMLYRPRGLVGKYGFHR